MWMCLFIYNILPHSQYYVPQGLGTSTGLGYGSYVTPLSHGLSLVPSDILSSTPVLVPGNPPVTVQSSSSSSSSSSPSQKLQRTDKLEVFIQHKVWFNIKKTLIHNPAICCKLNSPCCPYIAPLRSVVSFCGEAVQGGRQIAALLTPMTVPWLTPQITLSQFAWTTSRAAAPGRSASIFTRRHTYRPKSNPVNKSVRQPSQLKLQQPPPW